MPLTLWWKTMFAKIFAVDFALVVGFCHHWGTKQHVTQLTKVILISNYGLLKNMQKVCKVKEK